MDSLIEDLLDNIRKYANNNKIPILIDETASLMEIITRVSMPKRILEIGTAIGYSSIILASNLIEDGKLDTIELNPDMVQIAWENIRKAGFTNRIKVIEGDAGEVLPALSGTYDLIFMDAAKSKYVEFLPHCLRLVKKDGLIITDNVLYKGMTEGSEWVRHKQRTAVRNLREFLKLIKNHPQLKTSVIDIGDGLAISLKVN